MDRLEHYPHAVRRDVLAAERILNVRIRVLRLKDAAAAAHQAQQSVLQQRLDLASQRLATLIVGAPLLVLAALIVAAAAGGV